MRNALAGLHRRNSAITVINVSCRRHYLPLQPPPLRLPLLLLLFVAHFRGRPPSAVVVHAQSTMFIGRCVRVLDFSTRFA